MSNFKNDLFESSLVLESSTGEVDGVSVLGKLKGQFFFPNGVSRNNRFYSKSLWEKQLSKSEVKTRVVERRMFGTIGHEQPIDDNALLNGKLSHIVTNLYIDDQGRGIGEALILNTDAGRILNSVIRAKGKLYVSSRAQGSFSDKKTNGIPEVDENSYRLSTFDIVIEPGFLDAHPTLAENFNKIFENEEERDTMQVNETLIRENQSLQSSVAAISEAKKAAEDKVKALEDQLAASNKEVAEAAQKAKALEQYQEIGTVEEIQTVMKIAKEKTEEFKSANETFKLKLEVYEDLGTPAQIQEVFAKAETNFEQLKEFQKLGSLEQINKVMDFAESILDSRDQEKVKDEVASLAKELGVSAPIVEKLYGKMSVEEIKEFVGGIKTVSEWKPAKTPKTSEVSEKVENEPKKGQALRIMEGLISRPK